MLHRMRTYRDGLGIARSIRSRAFVAGALVGACTALFLAENLWLPAPFSFAVRVHTATATRLRLFYDRGAGFNLHDSRTLMVDSEKRPQTIRFPIRATEIHALRLLQVDGAGPLQISRAKLAVFGGARTQFRSGDVVPDWNVASITRQANATEITGTRDASYMAVRFKLAAPLVATNIPVILRWIATLLLFIAAAALILSPSGRRTYSFSQPRLVVALLSFVFIAAIALKLNGSSTGLWRLEADRQSPNRALIAGSPKEIRSDEWEIQTPWIWSQINTVPKLSLTNPNIGDRAAPLLANLPARHWMMLFRPQMWGFFCLTNQYAFALYWNFKWFALLLSAFLFLEVVTGGKTSLACTGAFFFFFSPYIQWWFSSPTCLPEMLAMLFFTLWGVALIFHTRSKRVVLAASILLLVAMLQFVFCCYPRFQIPLVYIGILLLVFGCAGTPVADLRALKFALLAATLVVAGLLLASWYADVASLILVISRLTYPGQIVSTGGDYPWFHLLAPFLELSMTQENYPAVAMNVCEAAGFLFLAPLLAAVALRDAFRHRVDWLLVGCVIGSTFLLIFMLGGIPLWLAQASGWSQVYGARALLPLGVLSTVGLFRYFSRETVRSEHWRQEIAAFTGIALVLAIVFQRANIELKDFVDLSTVVAAAVFFALVTVCVWSRRVTASCALLVIPLLWTNCLTNPISKGLPGLTRSTLRAQIVKIHRSNPAAKWLVLSRSSRGPIIAQFSKSAGAETLGGSRITPDEEMLRVLDPDGASKAITNRSAIVSFVPTAEYSPRFELSFINSYNVYLPLNPELFDRLNVGYIVEVDLPETEGRIAGFRMVHKGSGSRILARVGAK